MTTPVNQQFTTRTDRLWADNSLDLSADHVYKIDNVPVLSYTELGLTVTKSNLRQIGTLNTLDVTGDTSLADFAYFNSTVNRLGLGTNEPNASISILDNDVEIAIGSPAYGVANIGTYNNSNLAITTDNITRILVKNSGEVVIGDEVGKNGVLRVFGTLQVDNFVSDTRIDRTSSLEFRQNKDGSVYGLGLVWAGADISRSFVLRPDPDRMWASTSIDVAQDKAYFVNGQSVLSATDLGSTVVNSNLIKVGPLQSLTVTGDTQIQGSLEAGDTSVKSLVLNNGVQSLVLDVTGFNNSKAVTFSVKENDVFYADDDEIIVGNPGQTRRPIKLFGKLSVGVNNPDPDVGLAVSGNLSFADKKFLSGIGAPTEGIFNKGDICWNNNPQEASYVGWVCVDSGTPGRWLPFGGIVKQ